MAGTDRRAGRRRAAAHPAALVAALALTAASPARALAAAAPAGAVSRDWPAPAPGDSTPRAAPTGARPAARFAADTTRPRAVEYSDWYGRRLTVHRVGSYAMLPLFAAEYALGDRLSGGASAPPGWVKPTHVGVAVGLGALFVTNTVTGAWNLWDARHDSAGRTRRLLHAALLVAADAGFAYTATLADGATRSLDGRRRHRNAALASIGVATAGTAMMWLWRD